MNPHLPKTFHESDKVTLVIIPGQGGRLFQLRLATWALVGLVLLMAAFFGGAAWLYHQDISYRRERAALKERMQANVRMAQDLTHGRDAILRVAQIEAELRKMLKFKSEKALLRGDALGGPSESEIRHLAELLESAPEEAVRNVEREMVTLAKAAKERERRFEEVKRYVSRKSSMLASRPSAWPVRGWISSEYGDRSSPLTGSKGFHMGVDIANDPGTPVRATADGEVSFAGWEGGYGKLVVLNHGNGYSSFYGHLAEIKAAIGARITRGQIVGAMGSTGNTTGPHLHYEIRLYGAAVDPTKYMDE